MQRTWVALSTCLLAAAGCGEKKSAQDAARDVFTEVCAHVYQCCSTGEAEFYMGPYTDEQTCVDRLLEAGRGPGGVTIGPGPVLPSALSLPSLQVLDDAVDGDRLKVDEDALDACLNWLRAQTCNTAVEPAACAAALPPDNPCRVELLFRGQVGSGGRCSSPGTTLECKEGLACLAFDDLGVLGVCGTPGEVDDYCFTDAECRQGLYCQQLDGTCQVPRKAGEDCQYADPNDPSPPASTLLVECAAGLSCDPLTRTCVEPCAQGAGCSGDQDCDAEQGLSCILSRCDLPRDLGLPCGNDEDCQPQYRCEADPVDPAARICSPRINDGQPCPFGAHTECTSDYCDPDSGVCAEKVPPPGLCTSGLDQQCADSYCDTAFVACSTSDECPVSMTCLIAAGRCEYSCVALLPDGADCLREAQCASGLCVDGTCHTYPIPDGEACTSSFECASGFCGHDSPRTCQELPLADGSPCAAATECASGVCFASRCGPGLAAGDMCDDPLGPPCGRDLFCDPQAVPPVCTPLLDAGASCDGDYECRGDCTITWSRPMCDPTPPPGAAICDGA